MPYVHKKTQFAFKTIGLEAHGIKIVGRNLIHVCAKKSGKCTVVASRWFQNLFLSASGVRNESLTHQVGVHSGDGEEVGCGDKAYLRRAD